MKNTLVALKLNAELTPGDPENDLLWAKVDPFSDFHLYWNSDETPTQTELRFFHNDTALCFRYSVAQENPVLVEPFLNKDDVVREGRVEFFFEAEKEMKRYYSLEMDPMGRTLDYQAQFYRQFDRSWNWPALNLFGQLLPEGGYMVEGSLEKKTLRQLDILKENNTIRLGCYRAAFQYDKNNNLIERWISWIDPKTDQPDFHIPSSLGILQLLETEL